MTDKQQIEDRLKLMASLMTDVYENEKGPEAGIRCIIMLVHKDLVGAQGYGYEDEAQMAEQMIDHVRQLLRKQGKALWVTDLGERDG